MRTLAWSLGYSCYSGMYTVGEKLRLPSADTAVTTFVWSPASAAAPFHTLHFREPTPLLGLCPLDEQESDVNVSG